MNQNRGINQDVTQEMNRSLLLKSLRREGVCSRAHLASLTGLKQATVT
ncbi:MAG TPA: ROK family protein, partial [Clostridium sp.]|nr:ROK family protein [Clostridium sp.]